MIRRITSALGSQLAALIHARDGRLTRELVQNPSRFGLGNLPARLQPDATARSVCGFCSTGCSLQIHLREGVPVGLAPTADYPVNLGMACPKGWEALAVLNSPERAVEPLRRNRAGVLEAIDWRTALETFCTRIKEVQRRHGPHSVAFLSTGQIVTEEMVYLGALAKFGMGLLHGDSNTRQCMATSAASYKESFGFDAPPFTYQDFEESDVLVFIGANPCIAHPILWERVCRNKRNPEIVVLDPRTTETAAQATRHLALRPKSDLTLLYAIARILIERGWIDRPFLEAHTSGFEELAANMAPYTLARAAEETGLPAEQIESLAELIGSGRRVSLWWTMGVNQSYQGVRTAQAIINLALLTGNIGKPGTGANSITGQCNAMGSRLFGNTTSLLGGHKYEDPADRARIAEILGIPETRIPKQLGYEYDRIIDAIARGEIRGLWVIATNPVHSWIGQNWLKEILPQLEFLVVQDMYRTTETVAHADLVLPAAGWGEKEGTFINSERRIGVVRKVARAPGQALADLKIFQLIAEAWGCGDMFAKWQTAEDVFHSMREISRGKPFEFSGISGYAELEARGGIQWPHPEGSGEPAQQRRLFEDGRFYHADGRARLISDPPEGMPEPPDAEYPLLLLTGRGSVAQWHTQTRTRQSAVLRKLHPAGAYLEIHPDDARRFRIVAGGPVRVESRRGGLTVTALITPGVRPGQVFLPMHDRRINRLTLPHFDPYSRQPSYKDCAVRVVPQADFSEASDGRN